MPVMEWVPTAVRQSYMKTACEQCGSESRLGLHHLDENRQNNSPANLQTLCPACHTRWHWEHGKTTPRLHASSCGVCGKQPTHSGLCETHRTRQRRYGSPYLKPIRRGRSSPLVDERTGQVVSGEESRALPAGYPDGWTVLGDSATPSSRRSRKPSGGRSPHTKEV